MDERCEAMCKYPRRRCRRRAVAEVDGRWLCHEHAQAAGFHVESETRDQRRSRRKHAKRGASIHIERMNQKEVRALREAGRQLVEDGAHGRPETRADCADLPRPCPYVSCRWHLYLDVSPRTGSIKLNFPDLEPHELEWSCALDVAEAGGAGQEAVGVALNLSRERIRQLENRIIRKIATDPKAAKALLGRQRGKGVAAMIAHMERALAGGSRLAKHRDK